MFSKCVSCSFALLVGHDVHFLQTEISCCRVVLQSSHFPCSLLSVCYVKGASKSVSFNTMYISFNG
jgi:hypothetical protein